MVGNKIINEEGRNTTGLSNFFSNAVKNLKIPEHRGACTRDDNISHPGLKAIFKCRNHPSINAVKKVKRKENLQFLKLSFGNIVKEIRKLNTMKTAESTDITAKILKLNNNNLVAYICDFFSECIDKGQFPSILKQADITPVFKKGFKSSKENY